VFVVKHFWMQLHGSKSAKPTMMMGNLSSMNRLNKGKLTRRKRQKRTKLITTRTLALFSREKQN